VLLELLIWGTRHEETGAPCAVIVEMEKHREQVLAEVRRRWRERDSTPLLPAFDGDWSKRRLKVSRKSGVEKVGRADNRNSPEKWPWGWVERDHPWWSAYFSPAGCRFRAVQID
jgi:hypothetical protein